MVPVKKSLSYLILSRQYGFFGGGVILVISPLFCSVLLFIKKFNEIQ